MWKRAKRVINSYLDNLISKFEEPDAALQHATQVKASALGQSAAESLATQKLFEKRIAELELEIATVETRIRIAEGSPDKVARLSQHLQTLQAELADLQARLPQARQASAQAMRALKEHKHDIGQAITDSNLADIKETIANTSGAFSSDAIGVTFDEMRDKILLKAQASHLLDSEPDLEPQQNVDDILSQYKRRMEAGANPTAQPDPETGEKEQTTKKTLGPATDDVRPLE